MEKSNRKALGVFHVGIILLCLCLASFCFVGSLYASYTSLVSGSSSGSIANFSVSAVMVEQSPAQILDLSYATDLTSVSWSFKVTSESEVKAVDTVTVVLPSALPVGLTLGMSMNGDTVELATDDYITYTCSADIDFSDTHNWVLTFTGDPDTAVEASLEGIKLSVKVEQKD